MKTSLLKSVAVALVLSLATNAWGGNDLTPANNGIPTEQSADRPDVMPQYPGGIEALMNYITSEIDYPDDAFRNGLQGTCLVQFVVTKTGHVDQVKVLRSISPELDAEVVRVCSMIGNFEPGQVAGKPVNVSLALPVKFKLESNIPYISEELLNRANNGDMEAQYLVGYSSIMVTVCLSTGWWPSTTWQRLQRKAMKKRANYSRRPSNICETNWIDYGCGLP